MARHVAILALALTALVAGCLDAGAGADAETPADDGVAPRSDQPTRDGSQGTVKSTQELGSQSGSSIQPARFAFTVTVPSGGASDVRWELTVESTSDSLLQRVEGPGCGSTGLMVILVGTATFGGHCDDLAPGEHQFTAILDSPALAFSAVVRGQVTVQTQG